VHSRCFAISSQEVDGRGGAGYLLATSNRLMGGRHFLRQAREVRHGSFLRGKELVNQMVLDPVLAPASMRCSQPGVSRTMFNV
jgi:hypothetical protein